MAGIMLISYAVALSYIARYSRYGYYGNYHHGYRFGGATGLSVAFLIISIVEFFVALASSIYCCNAVCSYGTAMVRHFPVFEIVNLVA